MGDRIRLKAEDSLRRYLALFLFAVALTSGFARAQEVGQSIPEEIGNNGYVWPTDPAVLDKLDRWQDLKFGVIFHWGLYAVPGIVESWSICSEDEDWISRDTTLTYDEYKRWYFALKDQFNPTKFDPNQWSSVMRDAGMKYMVFTTKHHDGFCMFDSRHTDFTIAQGPFRDNPKRDVAAHVFEAFRNEGFMVGAYFSKPDWHYPSYWHPYFATPNRKHNYKKENHPTWWADYQAYTQKHLREITTFYGDLDILWLDGGWVSGDEVGLDELLLEARERHLGLISVDRSIRGKNENYQTPERQIPEEQLSYPWESCITLSNDWGWVPNAPYKSAEKIISSLVEIVSKGGSLLLGIGPSSDGLIEQPIIDRLEKIGVWMRRNGEAIYSTRTTPHYHDGRVWFTANKDGKTLYAIYLFEEGESLPKTIRWQANRPKGKMTLLQNGKQVRYTIKDQEVEVRLPKGLKKESLVFRYALE